MARENQLMEKMGAVEPTVEDFFQEKKRVKNPLVPLGMLFSIFLLFCLNVQN